MVDPLLNNSLYLSDKSDWSTPQFLFDKLNLEFDFNLDVCASKNNTKVKKFFSKKENGLIQNWEKRNWMNPPYGREISFWVKKAYQEFLNGKICVCLVPVRSDTKWWHNYVMKSSEIRLLTKRLSFEGSNNKAPFPAAIIVFDKKQLFPKVVSYAPF